MQASRPYPYLTLALWIGVAVVGRASWGADYTPDAEDKEILRISRVLKPIPDEQWAEIAGTRVQERYFIIQGDTLYDISNRLFGDPRYWPKIWALNNHSITNPHLIHPGTTIVFLPGSGSSLPEVSLEPSPLASSPIKKAFTAESPALEEEEDEDELEGTEVAEASIPPAANVAAHSKEEEEEDDRPIVESKIVIRAEEYGNPSRSDFAKEKPVKTRRRSNEWRKLPRQSWEEVRLKRNQAELATVQKVYRGQTNLRIEMPAFASTERVQPLGIVNGSEAYRSNLTQGDRIYIATEGAHLEVGESYSITAEPTEFKSPADEAEGYAYPLFGRVRILQDLGQEEGRGTYLGLVMAARDTFVRGSTIIPLQPSVGTISPLVGPSPMDATVLLDHRSNSLGVTQGKQIFFNRGSVEGLAPGMVFQIFEYTDPNTQLDVTNKQVNLLGEAMLTQVSEKFSAAVVTRSSSPIYEGMVARLLTQGASIQAVPVVQQDDELDKLDTGKALTPEEERELKQLENWKGNPTANPPAPPIETLKTPPAPPESSGPVVPPTSNLQPAPVPKTDELPPPSSGDLPTPPLPDAMPGGGPNTLAPPLPSAVPPPPPPVSSSGPEVSAPPPTAPAGASAESQTLQNLLGQ